MKRVLSLFLALILVLALGVSALAADYSYSYKDGKITGSITASGTNPETWVNGILMGGKDLNISVTDGSYVISAYMDGTLLGSQTIQTGSSQSGEVLLDKTASKLTLENGGTNNVVFSSTGGKQLYARITTTYVAGDGSLFPVITIKAVSASGSVRFNNAKTSGSIKSVQVAVVDDENADASYSFTLVNNQYITLK